MTLSDLAQVRQQIKTIRWYHEFDLPDGLQTRSSEPDTPAHRKLWATIFSQLKSIDFEGNVLINGGIAEADYYFGR